jgi:hypothetical protein
MQIYNGIFCCTRDNDFVVPHIAHMADLQVPMTHCLYYGMGQVPVEGVPHHVCEIHDLYENLTMKTYCMLKHALQHPWDRFIKTDVNSYVTMLDWDTVASYDLVGYLVLAAGSSVGPYQIPAASGHYLPLNKLAQPALAEEYLGPSAKWWVGGPAYVISRRLAEEIVKRGIWYTRSFAAEDVLVSVVAEQCGWPAVAGLGYFSDRRNQINNYDAAPPAIVKQPVQPTHGVSNAENCNYAR